MSSKFVLFNLNLFSINKISFYSISWNLLDYTCGIVPVTTVRLNEANYKTKDINDMTKKSLENSMKDAYGLPVSV